MSTDLPPTIVEQSTEWNIEDGYKNAEKDQSYPVRVHNVGPSGNINILLKSLDKDYDYLCRRVMGYKIFLHSPDELPQISKHFIRIPINEENMLLVKPKVIVTAKHLRKYDAKV